MTYVLAIGKERNLTLSSVEDLEASVVEVIDLILKDYFINVESLSSDVAQLREKLVWIVDGAEEEEIDSLVELFLLRKNISKELDNLFNKVIKGISISNDDDPLWGVEIYLEQSKLVLEAYSNIDGDCLWDALLKDVS